MQDGKDAAAFVQETIDNHKVTVFSKTYCPYCSSTKSTFQKMSSSTLSPSDIKCMELDNMPGQDGALVQGILKQKTGQRTVPNVFIGGKHVGGNSDVESLKNSGELLRMLQK
jgi:glutaredoxin 3